MLNQRGIRHKLQDATTLGEWSLVTHKVQNMSTKITLAACIVVLTACNNRPDIPRRDLSDGSSRVDSCDLRALFATCREYELSELDDWYKDYVERACPKNRRGDRVGIYRKDSRCPAEDRVARCEGIIEDPAEQYEYDKHYYAGTADLYTWETRSVQVTCENVSGQFVPE